MLTFGHGRLDRAELAALLAAAGVEAVVDVRRFPGSRANPAAAQGAVESLARDLGIGYRHDPRLGGRRHLSVAEDGTSPDTWWEVKAFRAYAAWTRSEDFRAGLAELLGQCAEQERTAIMCSEAVWWRCHRRIISDLVVLEAGRSVLHLMHDGRLREHEPSAGARLDEGGTTVWDAHPPG